MSDDAATQEVCVPTFEEQKFDRQLRLWGSGGQAALEAAHVILLGATAAGCELLKNMILPNLGSFTIVDHRAVTEKDLGSNFFLDPTTVGCSVATVAAQCLEELNPSVRGRAVVECPDVWLRQHAATAAGSPGGGATVFVCTPLVGQEALVQLSASVGTSRATTTSAAADDDASFLNPTDQAVIMYVEACGLVGVLRVQAQPRFVVHTHPDPQTVVKDLRALTPFPELEAWFLAHDPMDDAQFGGGGDALTRHSHLPWPCIVYHALRLHRVALQDAAWMPTSGKDYAALRHVIATQMVRRKDPSQESIMEALQECTMAVDVRHRLLPQMSTLLNDPRAAAPGPHDALWWFFLHGLRVFRGRHGGNMPLSGQLGDMVSLPEWFQELGALYRAESARNVEEVSTIVCDAMSRAAAASGSGGGRAWRHRSADTILAMARDVCRNCWSIALVTFRNIADEYLAPLSLRTTTLFSSTGAERDASFVAWYVVHRASRLFSKLHGRAPGAVTASPNPLLVAAPNGGTRAASPPALCVAADDEADGGTSVQKPSHAEAGVAHDDGQSDRKVLDEDACQLLHLLLEDVVAASSPTTKAQCHSTTTLSSTATTATAAANSSEGMWLRVREWVRYGGGELNATASIVGALAAQEAIKLIQQRRVPVADAVVFDGNSASCFGTLVLGASC